MNRKERRSAGSSNSAQDLFAAAIEKHQAGKLVEAVALYRKALKLAPDESGLHYNLGLAQMQLGKPEAAADCWREADRLRPNTPHILTNLGIALSRLGRWEDAAAALTQAGAIPEALSNLSAVLAQLGRAEEAEAQARAALALRPGYGEALNNLGIALYHQRKIDAAIATYRQAIADAPDFAQAHFNLSLALLTKGDWEDGWREREWRLKGGVGNLGSRQHSRPEWDGSPLAGKTILLYGEQGYGDSLQFVRYALLMAAQGGKVVLEVPKPLVRLFSGLPGIDKVVATGDKPPPHDLRFALMSLPRLFPTIPACPPLKVEPKDFVLPPGRKIGLVWAGDARAHDPLAQATDRRRSLDPALLAPLLELPGIVWVSLQKRTPPHPPAPSPAYGRGGEHALPLLPLPQAGEGRGEGNFIDLMGPMRDFADTAALVAQLDLVISVDTAVAHLAASLGKPVWILSRFDGCWRWGQDGETTPWYPTARLFRQTSPGDWAEVIGRVRAAL